MKFVNSKFPQERYQPRTDSAFFMSFSTFHPHQCSLYRHFRTSGKIVILVIFNRCRYPGHQAIFIRKIWCIYLTTAPTGKFNICTVDFEPTGAISYQITSFSYRFKHACQAPICLIKRIASQHHQMLCISPFFLRCRFRIKFILQPFKILNHFFQDRHCLFESLHHSST